MSVHAFSSVVPVGPARVRASKSRRTEQISANQRKLKRLLSKKMCHFFLWLKKHKRAYRCHTC